jgi:polyphosphate kinase
VAVVVELKARFDEAANIHWANYLEEAGIHVTYGVVGLKTHCKVIFVVVRQDYDGLRRYAHIGTGNYHPGTARAYSDLGLLTCDSRHRRRHHRAFQLPDHWATRRRATRSWLPVAALPEKCPAVPHRAGDPSTRDKGGGLIQFKVNALDRQDIIGPSTSASQAGVRVDLIVRDTCLLRPGIPAFRRTSGWSAWWGASWSTRASITSATTAHEEYYIGSADLS